MHLRSCLVAASLFCSAHAAAQSFNIDLAQSGANNVVSATFGGAADKPGPWNRVGGGGATLTNERGETASYTDNVTVIVGLPTAATTDIGRLRNVTSLTQQVGSTWGIEVTGLRAGVYDVYVYSSSTTSIPTGAYLVNGIAAPSIISSGEQAMVEGRDWQVTRDVSVSTSITIAGQDTSTNKGAAGFQIVARQLFPQLVNVVDLPVGDVDCPAGGVRFDIGIDNGSGGGFAGDGLLQNGEVTRRQRVCAAVDAEDGEDGEDGSACSVVASGTGATIVCEDGTTVDVSDGEDGLDGTSCTVIDGGDGSVTIACADGTSAVIRDVVAGEDGEDGVDGEDGEDGEDGASCTVAEQDDGSAVITCPDGSSATLPTTTTADGGGCSASGTTPAFAALIVALTSLRRRRRRSQR